MIFDNERFEKHLHQTAAVHEQRKILLEWAVVESIEMKEVAKLMEKLKESEVIRDYALFGAVAQMRYTEPVATLDADVPVLLCDDTGLDVLVPIYNFCRKHGHVPEGEAIRVGNWPVQFVPTFSLLTEEAVREAETGEIAGVPVRVVSAIHLAVIALSVGRPKDHLRILSLIEARAVFEEALQELAVRHNLSAQWSVFKRRFLDV